MPSLSERLRALVVVAAGDDALVAAAPSVGLREIARRFWPFARPYRRFVWLGVVLIALGPLVEAAIVWLFKLLVDDVLVPRDFGPFPWLALAYLVLVLCDGAVSFADTYVSTWLAERFLLDVRTHLFAHLHGLSLDVLERRRLGDLLARLMDDVSAIESLLLSGLRSLLSYGVRIVVLTAALLYLDWRLALLSLIAAPAFWLVARRFSGLIKEASRERRRRTGSLTAVAEESLANVALVRAYNRQVAEVDRFARQGQARLEAQLAATRLRALFAPLVDLIELAGGLLVVGVGTWELSNGRMSLGDLLVFLTFLGQLYSPIRGLGRLSNSVYAASASAERVLELLDERPAAPPARRPARRPLRLRGEVDFDRVSFTYPDGRAGLHDVSFRVEPGETLALVGATGAGKSTAAKLLLRFYDPAAGAVRFGGHDLRDLDVDFLREHVAVVLQELLVFDGTIRENLLIGRPDAGERALREAAAAADLGGLLDRLDDGLDTRIGQRGRLLSGGERQKVAIARAMLRDAPVLLLDEPTTGLDAAAAARVLQPLRRLMDGRATLLVSHDLRAVRDADEIVVLDHGRVAERGTHDALAAAGGPYERLWRLHAPAAEPELAP